MVIIGVYRITNLATRDFYIGSSKDVYERWRKHKCRSSWKRQPNSKLYQDMQKYGIDKFTFEILEETTEEERKHREQYYIETLKPSYNMCKAEVLSYKHHIKRNGISKNEYQRKYRELTHYQQEWDKAHRDNRRIASAKWKAANVERNKEINRAYDRRICVYNGEEITFGALRARLRRAGIPNYAEEAKKYLN